MFCLSQISYVLPLAKAKGLFEICETEEQGTVALNCLLPKGSSLSLFSVSSFSGFYELMEK